MCRTCRWTTAARRCPLPTTKLQRVTRPVRSVQLEIQGGGDALQVGKFDILALFDGPDGCLIGNSSALGQRVPGEPVRLARLTNCRGNAWRRRVSSDALLGRDVLDGSLTNPRVPRALFFRQAALDMFQSLLTNRHY